MVTASPLYSDRYRTLLGWFFLSDRYKRAGSAAWSLWGHAADALALLDELGCPAAHIVGNS